MRDDIVGICRFSFLGRCDWVGAGKSDRGDAALFPARAGMLFAPERLARRFQAFETLCLPSIRAQTDPDFSFWVLVSPELPAEWMARLRDLCAGVPQIRILVSAERDTAEALRRPLRQAAAAAGRPVIQFRADDDDALSRHHVARLRSQSRRFADMEAFVISHPLGLAFGSYEAEPVSFWRVHQPFVGAGVAARMRLPGRSIFSINHFQLPRHFPAFSDPHGFGYVQLRWDEGDSVATIVARFPKWFHPLAAQDFQVALAEDFPFLAGVDLSFVQRKGAATLPPRPDQCE